VAEQLERITLATVSSTDEGLWIVELGYLPPSINEAYPSSGNKRFPSKALKDFKTNAKYDISKQLSKTKSPEKNHPYGIVIQLFMPDIINKGWPNKAANRYKHVDVSNRVKFVEDAMAEVLDLDDEHNFIVVATKSFGPQERTTIILWRCDIRTMDLTELQPTMI